MIRSLAGLVIGIGGMIIAVPVVLVVVAIYKALYVVLPRRRAEE